MIYWNDEDIKNLFFVKNFANGSCMLAAMMIAKINEEQKGVVKEGYADIVFEDKKPDMYYSHTWIEDEYKNKIDPTKEQFLRAKSILGLTKELRDFLKINEDQNNKTLSNLFMVDEEKRYFDYALYKEVEPFYIERMKVDYKKERAKKTYSFKEYIDYVLEIQDLINHISIDFEQLEKLNIGLSKEKTLDYISLLDINSFENDKFFHKYNVETKEKIVNFQNVLLENGFSLDKESGLIKDEKRRMKILERMEKERELYLKSEKNLKEELKPVESLNKKSQSIKRKYK